MPWTPFTGQPLAVRPSKKATGRAQQTKAHRKRKSRR